MLGRYLLLSSFAGLTGESRAAYQLSPVRPNRTAGQTAPIRLDSPVKPANDEKGGRHGQGPEGRRPE